MAYRRRCSIAHALNRARASLSWAAKSPSANSSRLPRRAASGAARQNCARRV